MEKLEIIWTEQASIDLQEIYNYYAEKVTFSIAEKIITDIVIKTKELLKHPYVGQIERILVNRNFEYRYIVNRHWKIVYRVGENHLCITHVFDSRQSPSKLK